MENLIHIVVFDGTSAYVIPLDELQYEFEENDVEVLGSFADLNDAFVYCDKQNHIINNENGFAG